MTILCKTCGTSYDDTHGAITHCKICEDERQYVPVTGQSWIDPAALHATHTNKWLQHERSLLSIQTVPRFAINQRAFFATHPAGECALGLYCESGPGHADAHHRAGWVECHCHFASSLLLHDAGLGGSIRCTNLSACRRSPVDYA